MHSEDPDQTGRMPILVFVGFVMLRLCGSNDFFVSFSESLRTELKKVVRQQFLSVHEQVHVITCTCSYTDKKNLLDVRCKCGVTLYRDVSVM